MSSESFALHVWSGLINPKHYHQMGTSIWLFLLFIDWVTKEKDGVGYVLGETPVTYNMVNKRIPMCMRQYRKQIDALKENKYIQTKRTGRGLIIHVMKSKKYKIRYAKNYTSNNTDVQGFSDRCALKRTSDMQKNTHPLEDNKEDNKGQEIVKIWKLAAPIFNLETDRSEAFEAYKQDIISTLEIHGFVKTFAAIKTLKASSDFAYIKSMDDLFKWRRIDKIISAQPRQLKNQRKMEYCHRCNAGVPVSQDMKCPVCGKSVESGNEIQVNEEPIVKESA